MRGLQWFRRMTRKRHRCCFAVRSVTCAGMKFVNVRSDDLQLSANSTALQHLVSPLCSQSGDQGAKDHVGLLTRDGLARAIADRCEALSLAQARYLVDGVLDQIVNALGRGQFLQLHDVGTFSICPSGRRRIRQHKAKAVPKVSGKKTHARAAPKLKRPVNRKARLQMATDSCIAPLPEIDLELRERILAVRRWRIGAYALEQGPRK